MESKGRVVPALLAGSRDANSVVCVVDVAVPDLPRRHVPTGQDGVAAERAVIHRTPGRLFQMHGVMQPVVGRIVAELAVFHRDIRRPELNRPARAIHANVLPHDRSVGAEEVAVPNDDVPADRMRVATDSDAHGVPGSHMESQPLQHDVLPAFDVQQNRRIRPADGDLGLVRIGAAEKADVQLLVLVEEALKRCRISALPTTRPHLLHAGVVV